MSSHPNIILFARGVIARLESWPVLHLAIQEGWGGDSSTNKSKRTWLASSIVDEFEQTVPTPDDQYIEMMLLQVMGDEFEVVLEDGSAENVAQDIVKMWQETSLGNEEMVKKFEDMAKKLVGKKVGFQEGATEEGNEDGWISTDDESSESEGEDDSTPQLSKPSPQAKNEPVIDEDGFMLVQKKGKR